MVQVPRLAAGVHTSILAANLAFRVVLRCRVALLPLPLFVLSLWFVPTTSWEQDAGVDATLLPEILASSLLVIGWLVAVTVIPALQSPAGGPLGSPATTTFPVPRPWLVSGILLGSSAALLTLQLLVSAAIVAWHWGEALPDRLATATVLGSMGGLGLLFWTLLLGRFVARPGLLLVTLLVLLGGLSPVWADSLPLGPLHGLPFFPVSPEVLSTDELAEGGLDFRLLGAGCLHLAGLAVLAVSLDGVLARRS